jgi:hypothetical protein
LRQIPQQEATPGCASVWYEKDGLGVTIPQHELLGQAPSFLLATLCQSNANHFMIRIKLRIKAIGICLADEFDADLIKRHFGLDKQLLKIWQGCSTCTKCHNPVDTFSVWVLQANLDKNTHWRQVHVAVAYIVHHMSYVLDGVGTQVLALYRVGN